ncbi:DNA adenine methylase [Desulforamulus putei DSM 12395]|uniref:DNA adenine methylase n=1 Tax=Desulforamulus putei DSM 12395 TaxID=1121429 RepID=A0A1M5CMX5_9FIRM|nr:DNA adenine methylase [Desulforamulus putei DSM 12395]
MPRHITYLEPFFGSGAVFFKKLPSKVETINDIDGNVVNLFRVIRDQPEELARLIEWTPWARDEYRASFDLTGDPLEDARRFLVRCWQAFGQVTTNSRGGWRHSGTDKFNRALELRNVPANIFKAAERLKTVQIENKPAIELIKKYKAEHVLIYADPPYVWGTRTFRQHGRATYKHEMTDADHLELLEALDQHPGPVLLSGYACPLYDERLQHWAKRTVKAYAECGRAREEVLWINPVAAKDVMAPRLF